MTDESAKDENGVTDDEKQALAELIENGEPIGFKMVRAAGATARKRARERGRESDD